MVVNSAFNRMRVRLNRMVDGVLTTTNVITFNTEGLDAYSTVSMRASPGASDVIQRVFDDRLTSKQDTLTFDNVPVSESGNPVKRGLRCVDGKVSKSGDTMTGILNIATDTQYPLTITTDASYPFRIRNKTLGKDALILYHGSDGTNPYLQIFGSNDAQRWTITNAGILYHGAHRLNTDPSPSDNSGLITSCRWVNSRLSTKQDNLTFDDAPVSGSVNPVTSGGIKTAIDAKVNRYTGSFTGDNSLKSFQITHNLNDAYPNVTVWKTSEAYQDYRCRNHFNISEHNHFDFAVAPTSTDSFHKGGIMSKEVLSNLSIKGSLTVPKSSGRNGRGA